MSLILEALRKSEAERRRGSTPDVAMELPPALMPRARATPAWLLPAVVIGALALLVAWWWSQRNAGTPASVAAIATAPPAAAPIDVPAPPVVVARPTQAPVATSATPTPTEVAVASPPAASIAQTEPMPVRPRPLPLPPPPTAVDAGDIADIDATSLPPAKLSMHMWDESPARRFVILNGQRMVEGDRNGAITVIAIERSGVVVESNGNRARVPLP